MTYDQRKDFHAFPTSTVDGFTQHGMTLRDWFAGQIMASAITSATNLNEFPDDLLVESARVAYRVADAMLKDREQ